MAAVVEWYIAITALAIGMSHVIRPRDWSEAFRQLHRCGRPGAFANGLLSLITGAIVVSGQGTREWPGVVLSGFGWLMVAKGIGCLVAPDDALRSMARGSRNPHNFVIAGSACLVVGAWACYCIWHRT